jgi:hypothetical protein
MISNIFLFIPVIASAMVHEWIYFVFALGLSIFSPIYHYLTEYNSSKIALRNITKKLDWIFALGAHLYMYYFIFTKVQSSLQVTLAVLLSLSVIFFLYGFKFGDYKKSHPWFHVFASIVSGLIVLSK